MIESTTSNLQKRFEYLAIATFFISVMLVYYRSLFGSFIFDDVIVVLREPLLKKESFFDFLKSLPFKERPVRLFTLYIDRLIWGLNPFGFRFTNLVIHIINGILLFYLLIRLNLNRTITFFATLMFLLHFANPATVCYVTGRKDLLGVFFSLLAFYSLIVFTSKNLKLSFFVLFYLLAFFTKEMFITLPLIAFAYQYFVEGKRVSKAYVILSLIAIIAFTVFVIKFRDVSLGSLYKRLSIPEYFVGYLRLFFDPSFPKVDYVGYFTEPYRFREINWAVFIINFVIMVAFFALIHFLRKKTVFLSFLLAGFFISLLPVLQIIQHSESFAEHYFYFPSLFLSVFTANVVFRLLDKRGAIFLLSLLCLASGYLCFKRTVIFMSEENFWVEAYKKNPKSFRAKQYYGQKLLSENHVDSALKLFESGYEETKRLYYDSDLAYTYYYDFLNDLALCYIVKNDLDRAEKYYLEGLKTLPESDKKQLFLFNLSILYIKKDREKAKDFMKNVVLKNPQYIEVAYLLYDTYWQDGKMKELEAFIDEFLQKWQDNYFALAKKCLLLLKRGDREQAKMFYERLKKFSPANYYELNDSAEIEIFFGNYKKAREYLLMALEERPEYGRTKKNLIKLEGLMKTK